MSIRRFFFLFVQIFSLSCVQTNSDRRKISRFRISCNFCISRLRNALEIISDSDVYLASASSTESCDIS